VLLEANAERRENKEGSVQRTVVLVIVLGLAATAALAIGAAPALAADGCDCHTAVPPTGGASAAHDPYVAGVTACTTCHKGTTVPHPKLVEPKLTLFAGTRVDKHGNLYISLGGRLARRGGGGLNGVVVYLQQRAPGATAFLDVGKVTTHSIKRVPLLESYVHWNGWFSGRVTSPIWGATYRAVSRGAVRKTVVKPASTDTVLLAMFGLRLRGPDKNGNLKLGNSVVVDGLTDTADLLAGEKVTLTLFQYWKPRIVGEATFGSDGTFSWTVTPATRGQGYHVVATLPATAEHYGCTRGTHPNFRVK